MPSRFVWTPDLSVGVKSIDEQHKALFETVRRLFEAWDRNEPRATLTPLINELGDAFQTHLATEETLMKEILDEYENFAEHLEAHTEFKTKSIDFLLKYHQEQEVFSRELLDSIFNWWLSHIHERDKELGERLVALGFA